MTTMHVPTHSTAPSAPPGPRRLPRLRFLDAARGLAVVGMFLQHFASSDVVGPLVAGNTTLLFVLCGGISYSLMARRADDAGAPPERFRVRMLSRGTFIYVVGWLLILLNGPFGVILPAYAGLFIFGLALVRRSTRTLVLVSAALILVAPPLMIIGLGVFSHAGVIADLAAGPTSALALSAAFVGGMVLGRIDLTRRIVALRVAVIGAGAFLLGQLVTVTVLPHLLSAAEQWQATVWPGTGAPDEFAPWPMNTTAPNISYLFLSVPHSASTTQTLMGVGIALVVVAVFAMIPKAAQPVLIPLECVGKVALTMYCLQFVVVWPLALAGIDVQLGGTPFGDLCVALSTIAIGVVLAQLHQGPLEWIMRRLDTYYLGAGR